MTGPALREVVAAVDLGGTRTKAALVDRELSVVVRLVEPTPPDLALDVGGTVASVVSRLAALASGVRVVGCGVVVPGVVDIAFIDLGPFNVVAALTIAVFKATLVVLFFMHVKYSTRLTWVVVLGSIFWLGIMFVLTIGDYLTRVWLTYG